MCKKAMKKIYYIKGRLGVLLKIQKWIKKGRVKGRIVSSITTCTTLINFYYFGEGVETSTEGREGMVGGGRGGKNRPKRII